MDFSNKKIAPFNITFCRNRRQKALCGTKVSSRKRSPHGYKMLPRDRWSGFGPFLAGMQGMTSPTPDTPPARQSFLSRMAGRIQPVNAAATCIGVLLAYLVGTYVTGPFHAASHWMGAMLACTSVVVVLQKPGLRQSLPVGWMRVLGTFIGALIAFCYLSIWHFSVAGMLVTIFLLEIVSMLLGIYVNGHIATITLIVILLISQENPRLPPAINCLLRFLESVVGVGIGLGVMWVSERWQRLHRQSQQPPAG